MDKFDSIKLVNSLKEDLSKNDFDLMLNEESLYELERKYTDDYRKNILSQNYFEDNFTNILAFLGEVYIKKYGGAWILEEREGRVEPVGIRCNNGKESAEFIGVFNDIINELKYSLSVTLSAPYSAIEIECKRDW